MSIQQRELEALEAYLRLAGRKGASTEAISQRRACVMELLPLLAGKSHDDTSYREQVEAVLSELDKARWPFFLAVVREYYYFWINDIKAIAALHASGQFASSPLPAMLPTEDLRTLWAGLDQEQFSIVELWPLKAYASALRDEGASKAVIDTRCKLVKLLLVRLRGQESKDGGPYRTAVDATLPLFDMKETRQLFLVVVREFYYFWIGDQAAAQYITLQIESDAA